jgi:hypothetical protein
MLIISVVLILGYFHDVKDENWEARWANTNR